MLDAEPGADIVLLHADTRGAVETCLQARDRLDPDQPLVIIDCDIAFDSPAWSAALAGAVERGDLDGLLLSFRSTEPRYSFAEVDGASGGEAALPAKNLSGRSIISLM